MRSKQASLRRFLFWQQGLTLIELLVAISILATISVLGWRGLDSIVRARLALTEELEQSRALQLTFAQLQSDCLHLADSSVLRDRPALKVQAEQISMVRTVFLDDQPSGLQTVSYELNNGLLTRRESPVTRNLQVLDGLWLATLAHNDGFPQITLQSGIDSVKTRVWLNGGNSWSDPLSVLPQAVAGHAASEVATPIGLEFSLQKQGSQAMLRKIFLLGAL
jgi:general secretion pathway protein J